MVHSTWGYRQGNITYLKKRLVVVGSDQWDRTPPPCVWFPHQNPPTTRHSFMYIMLPCLAPCVTVIMCLSFFLPTRDLYPFSAHFWLFLCFIPAVPLLVVIATEEDYCRVVETFGYYSSLWMASVDIQKRIKYDHSSMQSAYAALSSLARFSYVIQHLDMCWVLHTGIFSIRFCGILLQGHTKNSWKKYFPVLFQFFSEMQPNNTLHGCAVSYSDSIIGASLSEPPH